MTAQPDVVGAVPTQPGSPAAARARRDLAVALFSVSFGTNVSTPLLLIYQERLGLSTWTVTALFAVYPIGLLPALLWAGPASDVFGRRRVLVPGVVLSAMASALFLAGADSLAILFTARFVLGMVSGIVFVAASAWMQELGDTDDPLWPARLTGMVLYAGFGGGPVVSGILGQWVPAPLYVSYIVHIALVALGLVACRAVPETVSRDPARRVRLDLGVPVDVRRAFVSVVAPTALGVFGFASMAMGLFPVLLRPAMESIAVFVTGLVAALVAGSIVATQRVVAFLGAVRAAPIALVNGAVGSALGATAFATDAWWLLFPAAVALGTGSGIAVTAGLRLVDMLTTRESRGAMTGSFYAVAYTAMTMPAVVTSIGRSRSVSVTVLAVVAALALLGAGWVHRRSWLVTPVGEPACGQRT